MEVKKLNIALTRSGKKIPVRLTIFKPDEHIRYRAIIGDHRLIAKKMLMLYRKDDGKFFIYETDYKTTSIAKSIAEKIRKAEKSSN